LAARRWQNSLSARLHVQPLRRLSLQDHLQSAHFVHSATSQNSPLTASIPQKYYGTLTQFAIKMPATAVAWQTTATAVGLRLRSHGSARHRVLHRSSGPSLL